MVDQRGERVTYVVTAPLVLALDEEGRTHHCYEGATISWLSDEQARHFIESGLVQEVGGGDAVEDQPKRTAKTEDWVEYAIRVHNADPDEVKALSRHELIELYGS